MGALYNTHQCEARLYRPRVVVVDWEHMEGWRVGNWLVLGGVENIVRRKLVGHRGVNRTGRTVGCFPWGWSYAGKEGADIDAGEEGMAGGLGEEARGMRRQFAMRCTCRMGLVGALYNTHQCEARLYRPRLVRV